MSSYRKPHKGASTMGEQYESTSAAQKLPTLKSNGDLFGESVYPLPYITKPFRSSSPLLHSEGAIRPLNDGQYRVMDISKFHCFQAQCLDRA
ncbi:hypothetical protein Y032_0095g2811 [Ancylostoma ceylanicum]|uniref:Uncharacterized protein n=1 Tax=Ancylostoma ceylanicum TaxID=53326 RepID=A0A016TKE6_9BILA|nr:hypothetical protein Y032_0095g2811 [Ancylostoma ceylanicum]